MADTRVRVPLDDKTIRLDQLDVETGGHGLSASDSEVVAVEGSPVTAKQLRDAIKNHVAPEPEPEPLTGDEIRALRAMLAGS